ncbi:MAG: NAD(P)-binding protein [Coriobacteriales bacterium]|nr:NAD(P)-binding protein [Coriobacteriales bacterium]
MSLRITRGAASDSFRPEHYDAIVVGAGFAGGVIARELAERGGQRVALIEQRDHIGGNAYDEYDETGVLVHRYGPHIFHSNDQRVFNYLSRFTEWYDYQHEVLANIHGSYTPVPFNLSSIELHFAPERAAQIIERLLATFGADTKVPIIELRASDDPLLAELADFVYENVFLHYTEKQWGLTPEQIDPSVTARVPVLVGRDRRYFQDSYQGMPLAGYTALFERLFDHPNISCFLGCDARTLLAVEGSTKDRSAAESGQGDTKGDDTTGTYSFVFSHSVANGNNTSKNTKENNTKEKNTKEYVPFVSSPFVSTGSATAVGEAAAASETDDGTPFSTIRAAGQIFNGTVIYTGPLDFLAGLRFGPLPYRSLEFVYRSEQREHVLPCGTVNYTVSEDFTRITEFSWLTGQRLDHTPLMEEYPRAFTDADTQIPYYPIPGDENQGRYERYRALFAGLPGFYPLGRLAEYRYYNMDQIVARALELADAILG